MPSNALVGCAKCCLLLPVACLAYSYGWVQSINAIVAGLSCGCRRCRQRKCKRASRRWLCCCRIWLKNRAVFFWVAGPSRKKPKKEEKCPHRGYCGPAAGSVRRWVLLSPGEQQSGASDGVGRELGRTEGSRAAQKVGRCGASGRSRPGKTRSNGGVESRAKRRRWAPGLWPGPGPVDYGLSIGFVVEKQKMGVVGASPIRFGSLLFHPAAV